MTCVRGCCETQAQHYRSVSLAPSACSNGKGRYVANQVRAAKEFEKDAAAYRRLRKEGLQPKRVDGSAFIETVAETRTDIEGIYQ